MRKPYILSVFILLSATILPQNPFAKYGYDVPLATSSKGEFEEFHGLTKVVEIGSVKYNTKTRTIVGFVDEQKTQNEVSPITTAMSIDPLCEKYYWISPYAYCLNNPVNAVDYHGDSVTILNMGTEANQHMGMLIQNNAGKWQYFSLNGDKIYNNTNGSSGGGPTNDIAVGEFNSPEEFMNSAYNTRATSKEDKADPNINGYGYEEGYVLPTTPEQDNTIRESFIESVEEGYNLVTNQCSQAVQKSLKAAGIPVSKLSYNPVGTLGSPSGIKASSPYLPSQAFKTIISNNPQGNKVKKD